MQRHRKKLENQRTRKRAGSCSALRRNYPVLIDRDKYVFDTAGRQARVDSSLTPIS